MPLSDKDKREILDWVCACQSAYHIDSTPNHRFGGLGSQLEENRAALIEYIEEVVSEAEAAARAEQRERDVQICEQLIENRRGLSLSFDMIAAAIRAAEAKGGDNA